MELLFVALGGAIIGLGARYLLPHRHTHGAVLMPAIGVIVVGAPLGRPHLGRPEVERRLDLVDHARRHGRHRRRGRPGDRPRPHDAATIASSHS